MGSLSTSGPFTRVAIVGLGLVGGSVALAIKRRWPAVRVAAVDRSSVIETALGLRAIDAGSARLEETRGAELVVLAAPVLQNVAVLKALPQHLTEPALVTDVGSTKRAMAEAARALPGHLRFIGGHPLAGLSISGVEAARPDLFDGRPWFITGAEAAAEEDVAALEAFVSGLGGLPRHMDPEKHDRVLAYVSHLPQLTVSALMHVVGRHAGAEGLAWAGRGLRDTTRLASSPASTWQDIVRTNPDHVAEAIDDLIATLQELRSPDANAFERIFNSSVRWKSVLDEH
jgi:prephenate dehydrogenase